MMFRVAMLVKCLYPGGKLSHVPEIKENLKWSEIKCNCGDKGLFNPPKTFKTPRFTPIKINSLDVPNSREDYF